MRLEQLEYLLALKESGSLSKTAEKFFITHQAISKSLKVLEKELGITLFQRTSKGVFFTPAGDRVCQFAQKMLTEKYLLERDLTQYAPPKTPQLCGELKIYAVARYLTPAFLTFIEKFRSSFPHINVSVHNVLTSDIEHLQNYSHDSLFLLTASHDAKTLSSFPVELNQFIDATKSEHCVLDAQELFACFHQKSIYAQKTQLTDEEAFSIPYVSFTYRFSSQMEDAYSYPYSTLNSFEQQKQLLKKGTHFGRYTQHEYKTFFSKNYVLVPLENSIYLLFIALYRPQKANSPVSIFLKQLSENIIF